MWIRDGRAVCYTTEPYGLTLEERHEIEALARKLGLVVFIREPEESLWYAGSTHMVEFWVPGEAGP